jgi:HAD superfamily hydrolase (TIGR01509 family)
MAALSTVLFDCGGVLVPDAYETILLHEEKGILRDYGLGLDELTARVRHVWDKYSVLPDAHEKEFWEDIGLALGVEIDPREVASVRQEVITVNRKALEALEQLREHQIAIGVVSNSTAFFYPYQAELLGLDMYVKPELVFLSHEAGITKSHGLIELAAKYVDPSKTLFIDDRPTNVKRGQEAGFRTIQYSMSSGISLAAVVWNSVFD